MHLIILRFILIGTSVIASVLMPTAMILSGVMEFTDYLFIIPASIVSCILVLGLSFKDCLFQAIIAGVVFWFTLNRFTKQSPSPIQRAIIGALIGGAINIPYGALFLSEIIVKHDSAYAHALVPWVIAGAISSAISAVSVDSSTYERSFRNRNIAVKPNPSFKRDA